jgi:SecD/SecF fusion protein
MAANETKKTEVTTVETKPVVKDSLSALLTNGGDSAATKKRITLCLTKLLHKAVDLF